MNSQLGNHLDEWFQKHRQSLGEYTHKHTKGKRCRVHNIRGTSINQIIMFICTMQILSKCLSMRRQRGVSY